MKVRLCWLLIISMFLVNVVVSLGVETPNRVAHDSRYNANADSYLTEGSPYTYSAKDLPVSDEVAADSGLRTVAFGKTVVFEFSGMSAESAYRIRAVFLSDSADRSMCVKAGENLLEAELKLPISKVLKCEWNVPPTAYADGSLCFSLERLSGPNAVISSVEIFSDNPAKLRVKPGPADQEIPQLTSFPLSVPGGDDLRVYLNGIWQFSVNPEVGFQDLPVNASDSETGINVPGEWSMQGFTVPKGGSAGYSRNFEVPAWKGQRIKLRFNAVYSKCEVWINGSHVGSHEGGFTPFELDVTDVVKTGKNRIALRIKNESLADTLASGSKYAVHPLGGISRDVHLFAVPEVHIASLHLTTDLDENYRNAVLATEINVANESGNKSKDIECRLSLRRWTAHDFDPDINTFKIGTISFIDISADNSVSGSVESEISNPLKWDSEHPNLYVLTAELLVKGRVVEVVKQRFGFREIEVQGNQLLVNGSAVKLHGACRHEVYPLSGRSLPQGQWRKDADIFRKGNCNFIRTSHYPPDEKFLNACDELGMFVEDEAPFCWARQHDAEARNLIVHETLEMVERDRNHPCVIFWSLANESGWGAGFADSSKAVRRVDPSRPQIFSYGKVDLASRHYPGITGPAKVADADRPTVFDEYSHLNAYNRFELVTDPGVRDAWGRGFASMWEKMFKSRGCLGGSLWAAIDDSFAMPDGSWVGYGTWGPIDGWRRPKPEYWHMKKIYSPIRIKTMHPALPAVGRNLVLKLENRFMFANLSECKVEWRPTGEDDTMQKQDLPDIAAGAGGNLVLDVADYNLKGRSIYLKFYGPRGFAVDEYLIPVGPQVMPAPESAKDAVMYPPQLRETDESLVVKVGGQEFSISKNSGNLADGGVLLGGPQLMLLPLNGGGGTQMTGGHHIYEPYTAVCSNWKCKKVEAKSVGDGTVKITVTGRYKEAEGRYKYIFCSDGIINIEYNFKSLINVNPRQIGIVFDLKKSCDTLSWNRKGQWTVYPEDHIGRISGSANAFAGMHSCGPAGPRVTPDWTWSKDGNKLGSNDFRSTKSNIYYAQLTNDAGHGLCLVSDGTQHVRTWMKGDRACMLAADYNNPGAERFFRRLAQLEDKPLKIGDNIKGSVSVRIR